MFTTIIALGQVLQLNTTWQAIDKISYPLNSLYQDEKLSFNSGERLDLGDRTISAWTIGIVSPTTSLTWNNGVVSFAGKPGIQIIETIGGDDVSDYVSFTLTQETSISINTQNAIVQLLNSEGSVVENSDDNYQSDLTVKLSPGIYYLGYSSESSTEQSFTSEIYLSP